jgi:uncharacterized coiled-coil protein SlyX
VTRKRRGRNDMDAKELTIRFIKQEQIIKELKDKVEYLEQEVGKLRLLVDDMRYDIMDIQRR